MQPSSTETFQVFKEGHRTLSFNYRLGAGKSCRILETIGGGKEASRRTNQLKEQHSVTAVLV